MIPYNPKAVAANTKTKSKIRNVIVILYTGSENVAIAVTAIIITKTDLQSLHLPRLLQLQDLLQSLSFVPLVWAIGFQLLVLIP